MLFCRTCSQRKNALISTSISKQRKLEQTIVVPEKVAPVSDLTGFKVLESYPLIEPFAYAHVVKDVERGNIKYFIEEPRLTIEDEVNLNRLEGNPQPSHNTETLRSSVQRDG